MAIPAPWEDVEEEISRDVPEHDRARARRVYEAQRDLALQRDVESRRTDESMPEFFGRRSIPFASAIHGIMSAGDYTSANERVRRGEPLAGDISHIAHHERNQEIDANRGFLGQLGSAAAHLPAIAGEFAAAAPLAGGIGAAEGAGLAGRLGAHALRTAAITPAIPSSYLPQLAQDNMAAGRDATDPRGLPAAMGTAYLNNLILGSIGSQVAKVPWLSGAGLGRAAARTLLAGPVGVGEQAAADALTSFMGITTGYGTVGEWASGKRGEAFQHAAIQALTFSAFSAMHEGQRLSPLRGMPEPLADVVETARSASQRGEPEHVVAEKLQASVAKHAPEESGAPPPGAPEPEQRPPAGPQPGIDTTAPGRPITPAAEPPRRPDWMRPREDAPESPTIAPGERAPENTQTPAETPERTPAGEAATPEAAPAVESRTLAERLRDRMRDQQQPASPFQRPQPRDLQRPQPRDLVKPPEATPRELFQQHTMGEDISPDAIDKAAKLTKQQSADFWDYVGGRVLDVIGGERGVSRQAVAGNKETAMKKLGLTEADVMEYARQESLRRIEAGHALSPNEQMPEEPGQFDRTLANAEAKRAAGERQYNILVDQLTRAKKSGREHPNADAIYRRLVELGNELAGREPTETTKGSGSESEAARPPAPDNVSQAQASQSAPLSGTPENPRAGAPESVPPPGDGNQGNTVDQQFDKAVKDFVREQTPIKQIGGGQTNAPTPPSLLEKSRQKAVEVIHGFRDEVDRLSGKMFPAITRINRQLGEHVARFVSAPVAARIGAPVMIDRVFGENTKPEVAQQWMDALHEERFRHGKAWMESEAQRHATEAKIAIAAKGAASPEALDAAAKYAHRVQMAKDVHSFIGKDYSLPDEAAFQRIIKSPEYQAFKKRWNSEMIPIQEANYKGAQGMDEHADISSPTQLPGHAFNTIAERTPSPQMTAGIGRGNLNNVKLKNNPFANEATLAADKYNTNYGEIISRTLAIGEKTARQAEMVRFGVEHGDMEFAKPGQIDFKTPLGKPAIEIKNVKPPKGTQDAALGETSLYVDKDLYAEMRQALQVDQPLSHGLVKHLSDALTKTTLASSAETVYHFKNLLTALFKPGVNPLSLFGNIVKVARGDMAIRKQLVELARIGVGQSTEHGLESGSLWGGKTDPTTWSSKVLHVISDGVRLTGSEAFDNLANRGIENTETNRRDFINQMTGQYNKAAQSKLVVWLRDLGLSPFATAASKFYMSGLQTLTGTHGLKTTSLGADLGLRAEVYGRIGVVLGGVALMNMLRWGNPLGDDNTPLGAVKLGEGADGKTMYFDLTSLTGLTRGARSAGLLALAEGVRKDQSPGRIIDKASDQMLSSLIHIAEGPVVSFVHTAATGKGGMGQSLTDERLPPSGSHFAENVKVAVQQANPLVATLTGLGERQGNEQTMGQRAVGLLGPFGPKFRGGEEVTQLHQHLNDLTMARQLHRQNPETAFTRFPQEQQHHILEVHSRRIAEIQKMLEGINRGRQTGQKPDEERAGRLRREQVRLARQALERVR